MWDEHKVWTFKKCVRDVALGARCVIGAEPETHEKDYPGKNNGSFSVITWTASANMDMHEQPHNYLNEKWIEYRRVFRGALNLVAHIDGKEELIQSFSYPDDGMEIPHFLTRHWTLPEGISMAWGISILRKLSIPPLVPGSGSPDYEYYTWDTSSPGFPEHVDCPRRRPDWKYQFIEVFHGTLCFERHNEEESHRYFITQGQCVFLPVDHNTDWDTRLSNGYGVTIYF